jgi:hypothetical protein
VESFEPGDVIDGKYQIIKRLGEGGMGIVLEATRQGLSRLLKSVTVGDHRRSGRFAE